MDTTRFLKLEAIKIIDKRINSFKDGYRQNLALLGDDKEQIFYILNKYVRDKDRSDELIRIYVNASYIGDKEFFKNAAYSILSEYLNKNSSLDNLISLVTDILPSTVNFIKKNLRDTGPLTFLHTLELVNKFITETSKRCVFVIDGFTNLKKFFKNYHQDFSQFIIFQKKCMVIVTSDQIDKAQRILSSELNFLFGYYWLCQQ